MSAPDDVVDTSPRVTLVPGAGIVIRTSAFLAVLGTTGYDLVDDVLALEESVSVPDRMPRRGRHLVRALAQLLATADTVTDVGFVAPDSVGVAVYLAGGVVGETDGRRLEPVSPDHPFDQAIPWPFEGLGIYLADAEPAEPGDERFDLVEGVVPAAGALLHTPLGLRGTRIHGADDVAQPAPTDSGRHAAGGVDDEAPALADQPADLRQAPPSAPASSSEVGPDAPPAGPNNPSVTPSAPFAPPSSARGPVPPTPLRPFPSTPDQRPGPVPNPARPGGPQPVPSPPEAAPAFRSESLSDGDDDLPTRQPLPKLEHKKPATEVVRIVESRAHVRGIRCSRGHLNHPRAWLCAVCGIRMDQLTGILVEGERPPLGWLLLDNGSTHLLDEDLVIGREPGAVGGRRTGTPKPVQVPDETGQLSRRHAEIRLVEWSVQLVDLGSANGTFVIEPQSGNREIRILAHRPHLLVPGSHVRVGGRHFIFESPHARI
ncbi:FHA domain-containing protein [Gordonia soli]|uniref:FHA domain-containing protein n=1 Tax=Gordonia soli NBRC 108243 TaxID=1223545 RepID=M0QJ47_9ACTN|nr:FHA domain-containing protein [Gordonia soli]GAC68655.1 hypothetical protein GS4_17_00410 [Gordonia soli NBRC 108243]